MCCPISSSRVFRHSSRCGGFGGITRASDGVIIRFTSSEPGIPPELQDHIWYRRRVLDGEGEEPVDWPWSWIRCATKFVQAACTHVFGGVWAKDQTNCMLFSVVPDRCTGWLYPVSRTSFPLYILGDHDFSSVQFGLIPCIIFCTLILQLYNYFNALYIVLDPGFSIVQCCGPCGNHVFWCWVGCTLGLYIFCTMCTAGFRIHWLGMYFSLGYVVVCTMWLQHLYMDRFGCGLGWTRTLLRWFVRPSCRGSSEPMCYYAYVVHIFEIKVF